MDKGLEEIVSKFPELEVLYGTKRIRCKLSGHEMPFSSAAILNYTSGKKFKQLKADGEFSFESFRPFIVPSELKKDCLFCALTGKYINKTPHQVKLLTEGKNYRYEKLLFEHGKKKLVSEVNEGKEKSNEDEEGKCNEKALDDEGNSDTQSETQDVTSDVQKQEQEQANNGTSIKRKHTTTSEGQLSSKKLKLLLKKKRRSITRGHNFSSLVV